MAITSIGYDGSVNESDWAKMIPLVGSSHYGVAGAGDWKVTAHSTMDRGVNIATGSGWGHGVLDTSDATVSLQATAVSSGDRWDMVVMRRNWSGTGGTSAFAIVQGTSARTLPTRSNTPGTIDEQPLALVRFSAGQTAAQEIIDLRCWGRNGGLIARDDLALTYLKQPGGQITINGTQWNCELDANGNPSWTTFVAGRVPLFGVAGSLEGDSAAAFAAGQQFLMQIGTTVQYFDQSGYARIIWPKPFPNGLLSIMAFNGDDWSSGGSMTYASAGVNWGQEGLGTKSQWVYSGRAQEASVNGSGNLVIGRGWPAGRIHRINWIAIGW